MHESHNMFGPARLLRCS